MEPRSSVLSSERKNITLKNLAWLKVCAYTHHRTHVLQQDTSQRRGDSREIVTWRVYRREEKWLASEALKSRAITFSPLLRVRAQLFFLSLSSRKIYNHNNAIRTPARSILFAVRRVIKRPAERVIRRGRWENYTGGCIYRARRARDWWRAGEIARMPPKTFRAERESGNINCRD